jgi:hypothetical protein
VDGIASGVFRGRPRKGSRIVLGSGKLPAGYQRVDRISDFFRRTASWKCDVESIEGTKPCGMEVSFRMISKNLSDVLRETICDEHLTAYALGKMSGVSAVVIQRFLTGERGLTLATAEKLAETLDLQLCRRNREETGYDCEAQAPDVEDDTAGNRATHREFIVKEGESISIGEYVKITVVSMNNKSIRLKIDSPQGMAVSRAELLNGLGGKSTVLRGKHAT